MVEGKITRITSLDIWWHQNSLPGGWLLQWRLWWWPHSNQLQWERGGQHVWLEESNLQNTTKTLRYKRSYPILDFIFRGRSWKHVPQGSVGNRFLRRKWLRAPWWETRWTSVTSLCAWNLFIYLSTPCCTKSLSYKCRCPHWGFEWAIFRWFCSFPSPL